MNIANNQAHVCFDPALYRRLLHRDRVDVWRLFDHAKPREVSRKRIGAFGAAAVYFRRRSLASPEAIRRCRWLSSLYQCRDLL